MRWRVLVLVLFALNVALAMALFISLRHPGAKLSVLASNLAGTASDGQVRTNVVVRQQFFSWQEIESEDYPTYVGNLRDIGCPETTIRDIIVADVNALYARRRATEVVTPGQQWWRTKPDTNVIAAAAEKLRALEQERRALLTRLLGPTWEPGETTPGTMVQARPDIVLDGPVLGALPAEVKAAVQDLNARSQQRIRAYLLAQSRAGKPPEPAELDRLHRQERDELAQVLAPAQLEEYLLRYSASASELKTQLSFFKPTEEEFRGLFRARDIFDQQIKLLYNGNDDASVEQRKALEQQREAAIKNALGPARYSEYRRLQDPAYREAYAQAQRVGAPETAGTLYEINQAAGQEEQRIRADTNLTAQQQEIELSKVQLEKLKARALALGQEMPPEPPLPPVPTVSIIFRAGDNLNVVAEHYNVSISAIREANPNVDFNNMKPGIPINVPLINNTTQGARKNKP